MVFYALIRLAKHAVSTFIYIVPPGGQLRDFETRIFGCEQIVDL